MGLTGAGLEESAERRQGAWGEQSSDSVRLHPGISGLWGLAPVSCVGSRPFLASYNIHLISVFFLLKLGKDCTRQDDRAHAASDTVASWKRYWRGAVEHG